jgi:FdhD protein
LHNATGGMHAAAWCTSQGELVEVMEDVGRHNALDKLIGAMIQSEADVQDGFALITSRASVEMVQKAATARMPALVAVSAPTALAVRVAEQCGLTLIAFARGDECVGYANAQHIAPE